MNIHDVKSNVIYVIGILICIFLITLLVGCAEPKYTHRDMDKINGHGIKYEIMRFEGCDGIKFETGHNQFGFAFFPDSMQTTDCKPYNPIQPYL